jgi:hypothetical protein
VLNTTATPVCKRGGGRGCPVTSRTDLDLPTSYRQSRSPSRVCVDHSRQTVYYTVEDRRTVGVSLRGRTRHDAKTEAYRGSRGLPGLKPLPGASLPGRNPRRLGAPTPCVYGRESVFPSGELTPGFTGQRAGDRSSNGGRRPGLKAPRSRPSGTITHVSKRYRLVEKGC